MLTLAATCAWATFYEMEHGTPAAQRDIYMTPGFALLLGLLGVNIFSVMVSRWPWKEHHTGFVIAHIGILTLLAGSLISLHRGLDSNMPLYEGETSRPRRPPREGPPRLDPRDGAERLASPWPSRSARPGRTRAALPRCPRAT